MPKPFTHRGFACLLDDALPQAAARLVIEHACSGNKDRVHFTLGAAELGRASAGIFAKAEFLRPMERPKRRMRTPRALDEALGIDAFRAAGLDVPRVLLHGVQPRWWPRGGSILVTERVTGPNAAQVLSRAPGILPCERVARALADVHARGLVHGDAAIRNFILSETRTWIVDLPRWRKWSAEGALDDLAHVLGSARKAGAPTECGAAILAAYEGSAGDAVHALPTQWRADVVAAADAYLAHLVARDETRDGRRKRSWRSVFSARSLDDA